MEMLPLVSMYDRIMSAIGLHERESRPGLAIILFITLAILPYLQTLGHDFVIMTTIFMCSENPHVQQGLTLNGIVWAFTTSKAATGIRQRGCRICWTSACGGTNPAAIISQT